MAREELTCLSAALLDAILSEYEIAPETVQHIMLSGDDLATAEAVRPDATAYYDNNDKPLWISKFKSSVRDLGAFRKCLSSRLCLSQ
jgi:hypothetical protein